MRESVRNRPKLFLTFAEGDLGLVRPVAAQLRRSGCVALDYSVPAEPFTAQRSYLIRASLALRIQRCCGAVCLYGARTLNDEWVRWTLDAARKMSLPLLGASLSGLPSGETADLLAGLGIEAIPLSADTISRRFSPAGSHGETDSENPLTLALRVMRHPLH
jgi:hypothetical protein